MLAVYETVRAAVERARAGAGPQAVEALTLRGHGHAAHDDARYVPAELRAWYGDPIERLAARLALDGVPPRPSRITAVLPPRSRPAWPRPKAHLLPIRPRSSTASTSPVPE